MKMRSLAFLLLLLGFASHAYGLTCYICNDLDFDGESGNIENCFTVVTTGTNATSTGPACTDDAGTEYCQSTFEIEDGVVISAARACASTGAATDTVPGNQCITNYDTVGIHTGSTTCVYTCTGDNCNNNAAASFETCDTDCNKPGGQGECNYIDGSCHCVGRFFGLDCSTIDNGTTTITPRNCVQCSSETESTCASSVASTPCAEYLDYCSTTVSKIFDKAYNVVKTVTVRGCTNAFVATDQCLFTDVTTDPPISDVGYREFTCFSTCDSDGCNTNTANGVIDAGESIPLQCVQCSDTSGGEDTTCNAESRSVCASGSTYCKSTVTYLISENSDRSYRGVLSGDVAYELRSVVRECATEAVTTGCTETSITGLDGLKKVTCTETCQEDGCNVGWPARPNCIQCDTGTPDFYDECLENPSEATMCEFPYQEYCVVVDRGIQKGIRESIQGYPRRIKRDCSRIDIGTQCVQMKYREAEVENCNRTCTTDGCNVGSGSSMAIQTMVAVVVPAILGWLAQTHL